MSVATGTVGQMEAPTAITGAAGGLGLVIADELLSRGRRVVLVDRDAGAADVAAAELSARHGCPVPSVRADLATLGGARTAAAELTERFELDALVNNAGGWIPGDQYPDASSDAWLSALTLNLVAPMLLTQLLWSRLAARSGAVVNIGSSGGTGEDAYRSPEYGAAKAGLHRFTASLGSRPDVRVMAVVPGWIGLDRAEQEWAALSPSERIEAGPLIPPRDIARAVAALLEDGCPGEVVYLLRKDEQTSTNGPSTEATSTPPRAPSVEPGS